MTQGLESRPIRASEYRELIENLKKAAACADCDLSDPFVLEFDHLDPSQKLFSISQAIGLRKTREELLAEIAKCELVCANCHKHRTAERHRRGTAGNRHTLPGKFRTPFRDWCLARHARRHSDDPMGDFLEDVDCVENVVRDVPDSPWASHRIPNCLSLQELVDFLERRRACDEAIAAARQVWRLYSLQERVL